jgi:hypothetical protein
MTARHGRLRSTAAALCFGAAVMSAVPAGAGSLLLENVGIGGAAFTMNLESFQEKKYKATLAQQYDFSCGSAALATLLTYNYNIPVSEQDVFKDMFDKGDKQVIAESGFSLLDLKNYLTRRGSNRTAIARRWRNSPACVCPRSCWSMYAATAILSFSRASATVGCCSPTRPTV